MSNPFDWISSITTTKKDLIAEGEREQDYSPFMVNRGLSYFPDTILHAAEMNMMAHLDKKLQYDFYMNGVRQRRRFTKWAKAKKKNENIELVMGYYGFSFAKAQTALSILNEAQLKEIKARRFEGGTKT